MAARVNPPPPSPSLSLPLSPAYLRNLIKRSYIDGGIPGWAFGVAYAVFGGCCMFAIMLPTVCVRACACACECVRRRARV